MVPTAVPKVGEEPALATVTEKSVGEAVYETYNYKQLTGARIAAPVTVNVLGAKWSLTQSDFLESFTQGSLTVYCTTRDVLQVTLNPMTSRVCLTDRNGDGRFESWKAPTGPPIRQAWNDLKSPIAYTQEPTMAAAGGGFRYELLYQGISGNVVQLLYREFLDDLVRPAFQQDLSYTMETNGPTEVSFRGTRIRIYSADNNTITYEVLSGLETDGRQR